MNDFKGNHSLETWVKIGVKEKINNRKGNLDLSKPKSSLTIVFNWHLTFVIFILGG